MDGAFSYLLAFFSAFNFHARRWWRNYILILGSFAFLSFLFYCLILLPPADFPEDVTIVIPKGATLSAVSEQLASAHLIAYPQVFKILVSIARRADHINAGRYRFHVREDALRIAYRIIHAESGIPAVRLTFPEGSSNQEVGEIVHNAFPDISVKSFVEAGSSYEGYLFPDTYKFTSEDERDDIIMQLRNNFNDQLVTIQPVLVASPHKKSDIIIMASLLEAEARTTEDRKMIAGILWNRIKIGMPLQVDAVFGYIFHRDTYSPTLTDLKVKSPYNTYTNKGLPPTPINNPGLDAISAAALPTKSGYLYYLTGTDGAMHYAKTFSEHQANRAKYLK